MTIKIKSPAPPYSREKKSFLSKLLRGTSQKEHMTSRRIRVRTTNPKDINPIVKSTKSSSIKPLTNSSSAMKLRKKLGLHKTPKSTRNLFDSLEQEANSSTEEELFQYEKEQQEYEDNDDIVKVEEQYEDLQVSLDYDKLNKDSEKKKKSSNSIKEKVSKQPQEISVNIPGEGTFISSNEKNKFIHLHDPELYDWSSEEGFINKKQTSNKPKRSMKKTAVSKTKTLAKSTSKTASKK